MSDLGKLRISVYIDPKQAEQQGSTSGKAAGQKFSATLNYSVNQGAQGLQSTLKTAFTQLEQSIGQSGKATGQAYVSGLKNSLGGLKQLINTGSIAEIKKQLKQVGTFAEQEFNKLQGTKQLNIKVAYQLLNNAILKGDFNAIEKEIKHINNLLNDTAEDTRTNFQRAFDSIKKGLASTSVGDLRSQLKKLSVAAEQELNQLSRSSSLKIGVELDKLNQAAIVGDFKSVQGALKNIFNELDGEIEETQTNFEKMFSSLRNAVGTASIGDLNRQIQQTLSAAESQFNTLRPGKQLAADRQLQEVEIAIKSGDFAKIKAAFENLSQTIADEGNEAGRGFITRLDKALDAGTGLVLSGAKRLGLGIVNALKNTFSNIMQGIGMTIGFSILNGIQNAISSGIGAVFTGIGNVINDGETLESLKYNLVFASGSAEAAAENFEFLSQMSDRLYQKLLPNIEAFNKFGTSARLAGVAQEDIQGIFDAFAQAGTVFRLTEDQMNGVFLALKQMMDKGKITAEEFTQQLGERIPGSVEAMQKALGGVTREEMFDMMKAGELLSRDVLPAFAREMKKITESGLEMSLQGSEFQAKRLAKSFEDIRLQAGDAILPAVEAVRRTVADIFEEAIKSSDGFSELRSSSEKFRNTLDDSPLIVEKLTELLTELINQSMETAVKLAEDFSKYLRENPDAISEMIDGFKETVNQIAKAVQSMGNFVNFLKEAYHWASQVGNLIPQLDVGDIATGLFRSFNPGAQGPARNSHTQPGSPNSNSPLSNFAANYGSAGVEWTVPEGADPRWVALLTPLFEGEGTNHKDGYRTNFGGEVIDSEGHPGVFRSTPWGTQSDAYGQWQWMGETARDVRDRLGVDIVSDMSPENQMRAGIEYFREAVGDDALIEQALNGDVNAAMQVYERASGRWPSLPGGSQQALPPDQNYAKYRDMFSSVYTGVVGNSGLDPSSYPDPFASGYVDPNSVNNAPAAPPPPAFTSPLGNVSIEDVLHYMETGNLEASQQDFTSFRDRSSGPDAHLGIDFDNRVEGGEGDPVQAMQPGVATWETWGHSANGPSVAVRVRFTDANGNEIEQAYGHMDGNSVIEALGVAEGVPVDVQLGQWLGNVGATDNLSSGPHLDLKVSINGQKVDPHEYLEALTLGGGTARTYEGTALPVANAGDYESDPNAIFDILNDQEAERERLAREAEQERLRVIQETRANQNAALQQQRAIEDQQRAAQRAQEQLALEGQLQRFAGTSIEPFMQFSGQRQQISATYDDQIFQLQRDLEDLQAEAADVQANRMGEAGIQVYLDAVNQAITATQELMTTQESLREQELSNLQELEAQTLATMQAELEKRQQTERLESEARLEAARQAEALAGVENPTVRALMEVSQEISNTARTYDQEIGAINDQISALSEEMEKMSETEGLNLNTEQVEYVTGQMEHLTDLLMNLEEERNININLLTNQRQAMFDAFGNQLTGEVQQAQIQALQNRGDTFGASALQQQLASQEEQLRYQDQLAAISQMEMDGAPASQIMQMRMQAEQLNALNLDNIDSQFQSLGETIQGSAGQAFSTFFTDVISGTKSIGDAFKDLLTSLLDQLMQFLSSQLLNQFLSAFNPAPQTASVFGGGSIFSSILGVGTSLLGGGLGDPIGMTGSSGILDAALGLVPFADGGLVKGPVRSLIGESGPELVVPLDRVESFFGVDQQKGGGTLNINIPVNIESGNSDVDGKAFARVLENQIISVINKENRPGGTLHRNGRR